MTAILVVLGLVVLVRLLTVREPTYHARPVDWEPPEDREQRLKTDAAVAAFLARPRPRPVQPEWLASDPLHNWVLIRWPDARGEQWIDWIEMNARGIRPTVGDPRVPIAPGGQL